MKRAHWLANQSSYRKAFILKNHTLILTKCTLFSTKIVKSQKKKYNEIRLKRKREITLLLDLKDSIKTLSLNQQSVKEFCTG